MDFRPVVPPPWFWDLPWPTPQPSPPPSYRLEGQKTAAFEVVDALGDAPDWLCIPMGNAGNISAYWMGFQEYRNAGRSRKLPVMYGFQASGSAPLVLGSPVANPTTIATAIRIGNPANWEKALTVREESGGRFRSVSDGEILAAYQLLAGEEGVFCEPASAASVAGMLKHATEIPPEAQVVCVLTGNGLKDPTTALENNQANLHRNLAPEPGVIAQLMGL
ncbi:MAG: pyridoxal-phosphate dependent enzyme [Synechococcus sp. SB0670_bin_20]|nr:pyridoxal-phosphate dependent enzyme [Synechococcus sp. SB0670_bin_20]